MIRVHIVCMFKLSEFFLKLHGTFCSTCNGSLKNLWKKIAVANSKHFLQLESLSHLSLPLHPLHVKSGRFSVDIVSRTNLLTYSTTAMDWGCTDRKTVAGNAVDQWALLRRWSRPWRRCHVTRTSPPSVCCRHTESADALRPARRRTCDTWLPSRQTVPPRHRRPWTRRCSCQCYEVLLAKAAGRQSEWFSEWWWWTNVF